MTIPIRPGPWSFLQTLGQGVGDTARAAAEFEKADRAEATQHLKFLFEAASGPDKTIKADALVGPTAQALMQRAGLGKLFEENLMAQPGEQMAEGQSAALGQILPQILQGEDQYAKERLAAGQVPTTPERAKAKVETGTANIQAQTLEGGGAAARRAAGVQSESVATAAEVAATDPVYSNIGARSVDASMTKLKITDIDPTNISGLSDQAWQLAQTDARSRGFTLNEEVTRPYIDAAIQQRVREAEERKIKGMRAGASMQDDLLKLYQSQQQRINDAIRSLPKPSTTSEALALSIHNLAGEQKRSVQEVLNDPATPSMSKQAFTEVQAYKAQLSALQTEARNIGDNVTQILGQKTGVPDPSALPAPTERRGGAGPSFESPTPPDAQGNEAKAKKLSRYRALVADEKKKPPAQRRPLEEILAQIDREFAAPAVDLKTYGKEKPAPKKPAEIQRPKQERSDTPTRIAR